MTRLPSKMGGGEKDAGEGVVEARYRGGDRGGEPEAKKAGGHS